MRAFCCNLGDYQYYFKGRHLALDGAWRSEEEIFGFDVALFKSFNAEADKEG